MTNSDKTSPSGDTGLESLFAAARADPPQPSDDFMSRLEADALAALPAVSTPQMPPKLGLWQHMLQAVGGWPGAAGLAAACAAGVWIGIAPPDSLSDLWALTAGLDGIELDPTSGFDFSMMEG